MKISLKNILFAALIASVLLGISFAEEPGPALEWFPYGLLVNDSPGNSTQKNPKIILSGDNDHIVVWEDSRNGYFDVYAQKISKDGFPLWNKDGVPLSRASRNQSNPQMISDGDGGAIVAWEDYRTGDANIYAQRIDSKGNILWGEEGLPVCSAPRGQLSPKIISDGEGGAIITWYDYRGGRGEDIFAQKIDKNGKAAWKEDGIAVIIADGTQWYPEIAADGSGGAVIVWTDFRRGGESDIYAQRISSGGDLLWDKSGLAVCRASENQAYPKIVRADADSVIIVWEDFREGNADIYAQKLTLDGKELWGKDGKAVCDMPYNQQRPQIAEDRSGGAIIGWIQRKGTVSQIYAQRVDNDGKTLWGNEGKLIRDADGIQDRLVLTSFGDDGGAVFTWEDKRNNSADIFAQAIKNNGHIIWSSGGVLVCGEVDNQEYPSPAVSQKGEVVFVWQDKRKGNYDIYADKLSSDGKSLWAKNGLVVNSSIGKVSQQGPGAVFDKNGNSYIIVWEDSRDGYPDIYAQKVDEKGNLKWAADGNPVCTAPFVQANPQVIADGKGGSIVVWEDWRNRNTPKIFAQKLSGDGRPLWKKDGIEVCKENSTQIQPKIVSDGHGGAFVVWTDLRSPDRGQDIYLQRISNDGELLFGEKAFGVCVFPCDQNSPEILPDQEGGVIISWTDHRGGPSNSDIYAQRVSFKGVALWQDNGAPICTAPESQRSQKMASDGEGGAIIVWSDRAAGGYDIYGQRIDGQGDIKWARDGIPICQVFGTQRNPMIVSTDKGEAVLVWEDYRSSKWDIYAQKIDSLGNILWDPDGVPVCALRHTQYAPSLISSNGGAIVTWEDYRNGESYAIYAQKIGPDGKMGWQADGIEIGKSDFGQRNPIIISNGAGGAVITWEDYRGGGYGIYAQRIRMIRIDISTKR